MPIEERKTKSYKGPVGVIGPKGEPGFAIKEEDLIQEVPDGSLTLEDYKEVYASALKYTQHLEKENERLTGQVNQAREESDQIAKRAENIIKKLHAHHRTQLNTVFNTVDNMRTLLKDPEFFDGGE